MLDVLGPAVQPGRRHAPIVVRAGGTAVTAALSARRAGAAVVVAGRVGADVAGESIRAELARAGVDARLAVDEELPTGTYVELGPAAVVSRGANSRLVPADVPELGIDAVLVSGYVVAHDDTLPAGRHALSLAAPWRAVTAVPIAGPDFAARARGANVLFANAAEAGLAGQAYEIVCVTHGAEGATVTREGSTEHVPPTGDAGTGAGDAFAGAYLAGL